jgi:hypothetical protein
MTQAGWQDKTSWRLTQALMAGGGVNRSSNTSAYALARTYCEHYIGQARLFTETTLPAPHSSSS